MQLAHARSVREIARSDGKARLYIFERDDGLYEFRVETEHDDEGDIYWAPTHMSGLYETLKEAEQDAVTTIPWLRRPDR
jgi:hypothetical protein